MGIKEKKQLQQNGGQNSSKSLNVMTERTKSWLRDDPFSIFKGKKYNVKKGYPLSFAKDTAQNKNNLDECWKHK